MKRLPLFLLLVFAASVACGEGGFSWSDRCIVSGPIAPDGKQIASEMARKFDEFHDEISVEWFGRPFEGKTHTDVYAVLEPGGRLFPDGNIYHGRFWGKDGKRDAHMMTLYCSREDLAGPCLKHEVCHAVFTDWFPDRIPQDLEEAIARHYDCKEPGYVLVPKEELKRQLVRWQELTARRAPIGVR